MGFTPLLHPLRVLSITEVISVSWFSQPAPLAGGFAGAPTSRRQTKQLAAGIMNVGSEEDFAATALAPRELGTHRSKREEGLTNQSIKKQSGKKRKKGKKEEKFSRRIAKKNRQISRKKNQFQTGGFPPLSFRR
jgi:hypothetical protein